MIREPDRTKSQNVGVGRSGDDVLVMLDAKDQWILTKEETLALYDGLLWVFDLWAIEEMQGPQ